LLPNEGGGWLLWGSIHFLAVHEKTPVDDFFYVKIIIPSNYPNKIPEVYEVGGRIPPSFHTYRNGSLCLGAPIKVGRSFNDKKTLLGFIEKCLIPYLYNFSYFEKGGELPFGELRHGHVGIIQCYKDEFQTNDINLIIDFLTILAQYDFPGYIDCPCHSGKKLWKCHGNKILDLKRIQLPENFAAELRMILNKN